MPVTSEYINTSPTFSIDSYLADMKAAGFTKLPQVSEEKLGASNSIFTYLIKPELLRDAFSAEQANLTLFSDLTKNGVSVHVEDKLTSLRASNDTIDFALHGSTRDDLSVEKSLIGREVVVSDGKYEIRISYSNGNKEIADNDGNRFLPPPIITVQNIENNGPPAILEISEANKHLFKFAQMQQWPNFGGTLVEGVTALDHRQMRDDLKSIVDNSKVLIAEAKTALGEDAPAAKQKSTPRPGG